MDDTRCDETKGKVEQIMSMNPVSKHEVKRGDKEFLKKLLFLRIVNFQKEQIDVRRRSKSGGLVIVRSMKTSRALIFVVCSRRRALLDLFLS